MQVSVEAVVAIIALLVALPPTILVLARAYRRYRSQAASQQYDIGLVGLEPEPIARGRLTPPPLRPSPQYPPWRTTSIRTSYMLFEATRHEASFPNSRAAV